MPKNQKRLHLTIEQKTLIIKEKEDNPSKTIRQIVQDIWLKHGLQTTRS